MRVCVSAFFGFVERFLWIRQLVTHRSLCTVPTVDAAVFMNKDAINIVRLHDDHFNVALHAFRVQGSCLTVWTIALERTIQSDSASWHTVSPAYQVEAQARTCRNAADVDVRRGPFNAANACNCQLAPHRLVSNCSVTDCRQWSGCSSSSVSSKNIEQVGELMSIFAHARN